jgi:hypothetical protein
MPSRFLRAVALLAGLGLVCAAAAAGPGVEVPSGVATHDDGRAPIESLWKTSLSLVERGWTAEVIFESVAAGATQPLPIIALRSPTRGRAVWILAGIHGEEPAGPNAIARAIDDIAALGAQRPVVLLPLLNPQGYARNWRYLNLPVYSETVDGQSVGDSSHLLPSAENPARARAAAASSPEAAAITAFVIRHQADYPVAVSIDLHEDNLIGRGYVYSQGMLGEKDPLAAAAVEVLVGNGVPVKMGGVTRFDEQIINGIVGPVTDSSIDELLSARQVIIDGAARPGPSAETVLVFETPSAALPFEKRVAAQAALLKLLSKRLVTTSDGR